jgi:hypothetical protein
MERIAPARFREVLSLLASHTHPPQGGRTLLVIGP